MINMITYYNIHEANHLSSYIKNKKNKKLSHKLVTIGILINAK